MAAGPSYVLTAHAAKVISERGIPLAWVERVLASPARVESERRDPTLCHALVLIPEHGDRVLRVIYRETAQPWEVITAYFDRTQRGRL